VLSSGTALAYPDTIDADDVPPSNSVVVVEGRALVAVVMVGLLAGCSDHSGRNPDPTITLPSASARSLAPVTDSDWSTYHHDNARTGVATGLTPVGSLARAWEANLDGAVYGQPLVIGDVVFAATEGDTIYALEAATGKVVWSVHVGTPVPKSKLPCGNIDPLGITSTMVYDKDTKQVFALAEMTGGAHVLFGIDASTGAVKLRRPAEPPKGDRIAHQQRSALTLLGGRVYIAYGGLFGDCGKYFGSVVSVPTTGDGPLANYVIPTSREAGIWAPGGGVVAGDRLYYAVGNGESTSGYDGSDSVIALRPDLTLADRFAPTTWADDNSKDLDLGSMTPAIVGPWVYADGKRGIGYVLRAEHLGEIGGEVSQTAACVAFGGPAVSGDTVFVPCIDGPRAITVDGTGHITLRWHASVGATGSPVVGGDQVWVVDGDGGTLYTLDPATGGVRQQARIGKSPHFASPTLARNHAYVGTLSGVVAVGWA
jgi:polyvinyl alcohol dehydrogenase (cytochrome)